MPNRRPGWHGPQPGWKARWGELSDAEFVEARTARQDDGCWLWTGAINRFSGYGEVNRSGRRIYAHRLAWIVAHGDIPEGVTVDHICHVRACVNPDHLRLMTRSEHGRADAYFGWNARKGRD